jgi:hypothetical protein
MTTRAKERSGRLFAAQSHRPQVERTATPIAPLDPRLLVAALVVLALMALAGCDQVKEQQFVASCVVGRAPLPGELMPGQAKVGDYTTSRWPWAESHPIEQHCDADGTLHVTVENKNPSSIDSLMSDPIDKALSMVTLPVWM